MTEPDTDKQGSAFAAKAAAGIINLIESDDGVHNLTNMEGLITGCIQLAIDDSIATLNQPTASGKQGGDAFQLWDWVTIASGPLQGANGRIVKLLHEDDCKLYKCALTRCTDILTYRDSDLKQTMNQPTASGGEDVMEKKIAHIIEDLGCHKDSYEAWVDAKAELTALFLEHKPKVAIGEDVREKAKKYWVAPENNFDDESEPAIHIEGIYVLEDLEEACSELNELTAMLNEQDQWLPIADAQQFKERHFRLYHKKYYAYGFSNKFIGAWVSEIDSSRALIPQPTHFKLLDKPPTKGE